MSNKVMIIGILIFLMSLSTFSYFLFTSNFFVQDYDDYINNPPCENKILEDGSFQISNCAKYKIKEGVGDRIILPVE